MTAFGPIGIRPGLRQIELMKGDLVPPHLAQEVLEDLDRQLLTRAAPIAEAEGREAGVVADRHRLAVGDAEDRAEAAVGQPGLAPVADLETW